MLAAFLPRLSLEAALGVAAGMTLSARDRTVPACPSIAMPLVSGSSPASVQRRIAVAAHAPVVEVTLSTAGLRVRISATGAADRAPVLTAVGQSIVAGLAVQFGITPDDRGLWALLSTS
ncbi:hypothetical protein [Streptomyces sp. NPDC051079]|uniref:hypothetical protein n=1 Tax=Streptomyces sp. NPDC051079 TaxID=3155043 RepID=UPI00344B814A